MKSRFDDAPAGHALLLKPIEPIDSHFRSSFGMVCTILRRYRAPEARALVERSFGSFLLLQAQEAEAQRARARAGGASSAAGGSAQRAAAARRWRRGGRRCRPSKRLPSHLRDVILAATAPPPGAPAPGAKDHGWWSSGRSIISAAHLRQLGKSYCTQKARETIERVLFAANYSKNIPHFSPNYP